MSCHPLMPRGPGGLSACALVLPALQTTSIPKGQVQSISTESSQLLLLSTVRPPWFAMHSATKHMTLQATAHTGYRLQPTQATGYSPHRLQATAHTGYRLQPTQATGYSLHRLQATVHTGYRLQSTQAIGYSPWNFKESNTAQ